MQLRYHQKSIEELLSYFPLFQGLDPHILKLVASESSFKKMAKHAIIYKMDAPADSVYFLLRGSVKIGAHFDDGREVIKRILHPFSMFGELGIIGEENYRDFGSAMTADVQMVVVPIKTLTRLLPRYSDLSMRVLNLLGDRLRQVENRLESLIFKDARRRIIDFLKESASRQGKRVGYEMLIKHSLTQQDIANITGTSRQTVTSVLNDLRRANLIYFNRRSILIRDLAKLS
ncbi:MAG: Crp/Fnr family transcriptional regulator [Saprospiraceae bacterium]|nr:Crp/Fnr family transcriptional regulator [Saprospiraceae bacterium]